MLYRVLLGFVLLASAPAAFANEAFDDAGAWSRCTFAEMTRAYGGATDAETMARWANASTWLAFCESTIKAGDYEAVDAAIETFMRQNPDQASAFLLGQRGHALGRRARVASWWEFCASAEGAYAGFVQAHRLDPRDFRARVGLGAIQAGVLGTRPWSLICDLGRSVTWSETLAFLDAAIAVRETPALHPVERLMAKGTLIRAYQHAFAADPAFSDAAIDIGTGDPVRRADAVRIIQDELRAGLARLPKSCACVSRAVDEALDR